MPAIPSVVISVVDNGQSASLAVPQSSVALLIGSAIGGSPNQPFASISPTAIQTQFVGGALVEAAGLVCQAGGVALCVSCPIATKGALVGGVQATTPNGSTSAITVTVDPTNGPWDEYFVVVKAAPGGGGTIGTSGIQLLVSLDAGRNWSNPIPLGTATTLVLGAPYSPATIGATGLQLNFGAGTIVVGDSWQFATSPPQPNAAGTAAAIAAFQASQYGVTGVGSTHCIGDVMHGGSTVDDIPTIQTALQAGVAIYEYQRAIVELRGPHTPTAWGGSGETEAAWMTALETAMSSVAAPRICADAGNYNMPSPFSNAAGGQPSYRRNLAWAHAARRVTIQLNQRAGEVDLGPYTQIAVNAASDPSDGFIYHDERVTPGLNAARIGTAMSWPKKGAGFFQCQEPLLCAAGSQFTELAIGNVVDAACDIAYAAAVEIVSSALLVQSNGTLNAFELARLQGEIQNAENQGLVNNGLASSVTTTVSSTHNVLADGEIPVAIVVVPEPFANAIDVSISVSNGNG